MTLILSTVRQWSIFIKGWELIKVLYSGNIDVSVSYERFPDSKAIL
jgi:hypothetical protein